MASEAPPFWWESPDWRAWALSPLSAAYGFAAARRMHGARRLKIDAPVLCIGNFTVGGTGKTPIAVALARQAKRMRFKPGILSRGHGGSTAAPHLVEPGRDSARHVGDEPLILAEQAPVAVTPDRAAGARLLAEQGCDFLIMDDGFQSARIHIDYALIVVDARYGIGNGHVIPAGPLRAPLVDQMRFADAVLRMGDGDSGDATIRAASRAGLPVFEARVRPRKDQAVAGRRFLAFAGIGHPDKFFDTVAQAGGTVALSRSFPDHHFFTEDELQEMAAAAAAGELGLITTAKDAVRLRHGSAGMKEFLAKTTVLEIEAAFDPPSSAQRIIEDTLEAWRKRRHS